jgi:hypothetical protein
LIWPFKSKDVQSVIQDLDRCTKAIYSALEVDQTSILLDIDHQMALDRLRVAEGASFDSYAEKHNPTCLQNTRVELFKDVQLWIDDTNSKVIFWLNGMAGTGKSTISRTVAQARHDRGDLGASFFFKRGEIDRGSLAKFVSTLAHQLALSIPGLAPLIKESDRCRFENRSQRCRRPVQKAHTRTTVRSSCGTISPITNRDCC